ncbi:MULTISPECIES: hydroxyethylthiazole kinase [Cetobacterium]|uniref:Hydroxyethylthiazole kinase n=1 Tax=Candidatus Cetobacterium colombiensis TaxID=3073100 RepID=A0ABU4WBK2_9FUSO|nr:hydroxyethylthiazole kinase [Candidatus Cetobacterium colombiensis]MDX8336054.1 hydroxyethylthiazole kinase [Candidatus Cetobacterium colombiensis]
MNRELLKKELLNDIEIALEKVKEITPLVYHLTNTVTINDCANITLAIGASPLMSFCIEELEEIIGFSSSVVLNIGTMDKSMRDMIVEVGKIANRLKKPIVLDPVGVGATKARKELIERILKEVKVSVIKGNMAEIKSILNIESQSRGVDSLDNESSGIEIVKLAAKKLKTTIAITGKIDYVGNEEMVVEIRNGHKKMGLVTGTGCMISSLIGSFLGGDNSSLISSVAGVLAMGIAGELSEKDFIGTGSLKVNIIDNISKLNNDIIRLNEKITPTI